jgi:hypothetical protein
MQKANTGAIRIGTKAPTQLPAFNENQALINRKRALYDKHGVVTTQGFIRAETLLQAGQSTIPFYVNQNQASQQQQTATEHRLTQNDTFTITNIAIYISKLGTSTPANVDYLTQVLRTFPNAQVFTGTTEAERLQAIYNGYLQLRLDTLVIVDSIPVMNYYRAPQSQQGVGAATGVIGIQRDEWPVSLYGSRDSKPTIEINGSKNNMFQIILSQNGASIDLSPGDTPGVGANNCILMLQGLLHQGAAGVQDKVQAELDAAERKGLAVVYG